MPSPQSQQSRHHHPHTTILASTTECTAQMQCSSIPGCLWCQQCQPVMGRHKAVHAMCMCILKKHKSTCQGCAANTVQSPVSIQPSRSKSGSVTPKQCMYNADSTQQRVKANSPVQIPRQQHRQAGCCQPRLGSMPPPPQKTGAEAQQRAYKVIALPVYLKPQTHTVAQPCTVAESGVSDMLNLVGPKPVLAACRRKQVEQTSG